MGTGVLLALLAALFSSFKGIARKHVARDFSSVEIGYIGQVYGVVLLLPLAVWRFAEVGMSPSPELLFTVVLSSGIILASTYIYIEALRITDISITEPLRNTSPIFVALLEPLILGINLSYMIIVAAFLGSAGAYILVSEKSLLTPVENLKNRGAIMSILVAFLLSLYSLTQRFGATNMDPILFIYLIYLTTLTGFWLWKTKGSGSIELKSYLRRDVFALGTVTAATVVTSIFAYSLITASEVTVVKQTSAVFSVLIGGRFFREDDLTRKMIGALVIFAGVILVAI